MLIDDGVRARFLDKAVPEPNSGCWLWDGAQTPSGYGSLRVDGKTRKATHISLSLDGRPRPDGHMACHTCDNPSCVNPQHLYWGTGFDNMRDAAKRGRSNRTTILAVRYQNPKKPVSAQVWLNRGTYLALLLRDGKPVKRWRYATREQAQAKRASILAHIEMGAKRVTTFED